MTDSITTGEAFIADCVLQKHIKDPQNAQRFWQFAYNELHTANPALAEKIAGTNADPFYVEDKDRWNDPRAAAFVNAVIEQWT